MTGRKSLTSALLALLLGACGVMESREEADPDQTWACGRQCVVNGEACSEFYGRKNEEQRLLFEQSKENYWICLKKYPESGRRDPAPCLPPTPMREAYDDCGQRLDECLAACATSLEQLADLEGKRRGLGRGETSPPRSRMPTSPPGPE